MALGGCGLVSTVVAHVNTFHLRKMRFFPPRLPRWIELHFGCNRLCRGVGRLGLLAVKSASWLDQSPLCFPFSDAGAAEGGREGESRARGLGGGDRPADGDAVGQAGCGGEDPLLTLRLLVLHDERRTGLGDCFQWQNRTLRHALCRSSADTKPPGVGLRAENGPADCEPWPGCPSHH